MDLEKKAKVLANLKIKHGLRDKFIHDSKQEQEASIAFRKNLLERQLRVNYVNEFDRLKGHSYANKNLPAPTKTHLEEILNKLQELARQSLYDKDNLYEDNVDNYKV